MKINLIVFLLVASAFLSGASHSALHPTRIPFCGFSKEDGYYGYQKREYITRIAKIGDESGIPDVISRIQGTLSFSVPITVCIAKAENNCFATTTAGGGRLIVADQNFLNSVNTSAGTKWAAISVMAHEVGHHIAGFNRYATPLRGELDADYWSGYVLQKLGSSTNAATKCIMATGTEEDTNSHPNKYTRAETIRAGWNDAQQNRIDYSHCADCKP